MPAKVSTPTSPGHHVIVDESILFWAFRYCLGRKTYAVADCVHNILVVWPRLSRKTRGQIVTEIQQAIAEDSAGMPMDKQEWLRVVERAREDGDV